MECPAKYMVNTEKEISVAIIVTFEISIQVSRIHLA